MVFRLDLQEPENIINMLDWIEKNIHLSNINEVCVVIIAAILTVGFPIFFQIKKDIEEKYNSNHLTELFKKQSYYKYFIFFLKSSIIVLIPWVLQLEPISGFDNYIINNSAKILIIVSSIFLIYFFFKLIKTITIFSVKSDLFKHLKKEYYEEKKKSWLQEKLENYIND